METIHIDVEPSEPEEEVVPASEVEELTEAVEALNETFEEALSEPVETAPEIDAFLALQRQIDGLQAQIDDIRQAAIVETVIETEPETIVEETIEVEPVGEIIEPQREMWHIELLHKLPRWMW